MYKKGFTMIELLVVVIIMATLTSIMMPQYRRVVDRSKAAEVMQLLPAIFESRERWIVEHDCFWTSSGASSLTYTCSDGASSLTFKKLDITTNGSISEDGKELTTENFKYYLMSGLPTGGTQPCVKAVPTYGTSRNLDKSTIWFRGDKLTCQDQQSDSQGCEILNIEKSTTGCK